MAVTPVSLFTPVADPHEVLAVIRSVAPDVIVDVEPASGLWRSATIPHKDPDRWPLRFNHGADYYREPGWSEQLAGLRRYLTVVSAQGDASAAAAVLDGLPPLRSAYAVALSCQLDLDALPSEDLRLGMLYAVAQRLGAVLFAPPTLRDAHGQVLLGAGVPLADAVPPTRRIGGPPPAPAAPAPLPAEAVTPAAAEPVIAPSAEVVAPEPVIPEPVIPEPVVAEPRVAEPRVADPGVAPAPVSIFGGGGAPPTIEPVEAPGGAAGSDPRPAAADPSAPAAAVLGDPHATIDLTDAAREAVAADPSARRVALRALALAAVCSRAFLEQDDPEEVDQEGERQRIEQWVIEVEGLDAELEPDEWRILQSGIEMLDDRAGVDAAWRIEGLAVLVWALGLAELFA